MRHRPPRFKPEFREVPETYRVPWPYQPLLRRWTCRSQVSGSADDPGSADAADREQADATPSDPVQRPEWTRRHDDWRTTMWWSLAGVLGLVLVLAGARGGSAALALPGLGLLLFVAVMWFRRTRGADVEIWFPSTPPRTGETLIVGLDPTAGGAPLEWVNVHLRCVALSTRGDVFVLGESRPEVSRAAADATDPGAGMRLEVPIPDALPPSGPWGTLTILWGLIVIWKSGDRPSSRSYSVRVSGRPGPGPGSPRAARVPMRHGSPDTRPGGGWLVVPSAWDTARSGSEVLRTLSLGFFALLALFCGVSGLVSGAPGLLLFTLAGGLVWFVPALQPAAPSRGFLLLAQRSDGRPGELRARATRGSRLLVGFEAEVEARGPGSERQLVDAASVVLPEPGTDFTHPALVSHDVGALADSVPRSQLVAIVRWQFLGQPRRPVTEFVLTERTGP